MEEKCSIEDIDANDIKKMFIELRKREDNRLTCYVDILSYLGYESDLDMPIIDAFFIKAVEKTFGKLKHEADIVLMALGLLEGYDYTIETIISDRRAKYLQESYYLQHDNPAYINASKEDKDKYKRRLESTEDKMLLKLSIFLNRLQDNKKLKGKPQDNEKIRKFLVDIDKYMDDGVAILPIPSYIKRRPLQDRIKMAVIKYIFLDNEAFIERHHILINRNNECEIEIDLSKKLTDELKKKFVHALSAVAVSFFVISAVFILRLFVYGQDLKLDTTHDNKAKTENSADDEPTQNNNSNSESVNPF